jgi:hypothetical protein
VPTTTTTTSSAAVPRRRFTEGSPIPATAADPVKSEPREKSTETVLPDSTADAVKAEAKDEGDRDEAKKEVARSRSSSRCQEFSNLGRKLFGHFFNI